jgi:hypothetical protein
MVNLIDADGWPTKALRDRLAAQYDEEPERLLETTIRIVDNARLRSYPEADKTEQF